MHILDMINEFIASNNNLVLIGAITLIEIAPIKINPWSFILKKIGNVLIGDIKKEIQDLKRDFEETNADNMRGSILDFARSCRKHEEHTEEEWNRIITKIKKYETYVKDKNIDNGVIEEASVYLRKLYHERLSKNDFL